MADDSPGPARLIEALDVARNARIGFGVGLVLAVLMYAYRVAELGGPITVNTTTNSSAPAAPPESPALFLMLAFVLAVSAGALVTALLTVGSAIRLAREVE